VYTPCTKYVNLYTPYQGLGAKTRNEEIPEAYLMGKEGWEVWK
jgi:hypothetical protein